MHRLSTSYQHELALSSYFPSGDYLSIRGLSRKHTHPISRQEMEVVNESLQSVFPLTYRLLEAEDWDLLIQEFVLSNGSFSPKVWYMPKEFYLFILRNGDDYLEKYICLKDLLLLEWLEIELCMADYYDTTFHEEGALSVNKLVLNPIHRLQRFSFPVHSRNAKFIKENDKGDYCLVLHRLPESGEIMFTQLFPPYLHMVVLLMQGPLSIDSLISQVGLDLTNKNRLDAEIFFKRAIDTQLVLGFC